MKALILKLMDLTLQRMVRGLCGLDRKIPPLS